MSDTLERWTELADAEAVGEALSAEDRAFLQAHGDDHGIADERDLFAELGQLGEASVVREDDRRRAIDTMARFDAQVATRRRGRWLAAAGVAGLSAAAAVLLWAALPRGPAVLGEPTPMDARVSQGSFVSTDDGTTTGETVPGQRWVRAVDRACVDVAGARACFEPDSELRLVDGAVELRAGQVEIEAGEITVIDDGPGRVLRSGERWRVDDVVVAERAVDPVDDDPTLEGDVLIDPADGTAAEAQPNPAPGRVASRRSGRDDGAAAESKSAGQMLSEARALANAGSLARAVAGYEALQRAHADSAEAHAAHVSLGELQLRRGRAKDALRAFERYLARGGGLAEEARWGRVRALDRLGRDGARDQAIDDLLARHPRTIYATDARALRGG